MEAVKDVEGKDHPEEDEGEDSLDEGAADDGGGTAAVLSDSMVPLVGDSILQVNSKLYMVSCGKVESCDFQGSESTMESTSANSSRQDQE